MDTGSLSDVNEADLKIIKENPFQSYNLNTLYLENATVMRKRYMNCTYCFTKRNLPHSFFKYKRDMLYKAQAVDMSKIF